MTTGKNKSIEELTTPIQPYEGELKNPNSPIPAESQLGDYTDKDNDDLIKEMDDLIREMASDFNIPSDEEINKNLAEKEEAADWTPEENQKEIDNFELLLELLANSPKFFDLIKKISGQDVNSLLNDKEILDLCVNNKMIIPYKKGPVRTDHRGKILSYGLSTAGYDSVMAYKLKLPVEVRNKDGSVKPLDPKNPDDAGWVDITIDPNSEDPTYTINPGEHILSSTKEYFRMPNDVLAICLGKSTYARAGIIINVTPLEPGWEGNVTLEIHNTTNRPVILYPGEGICQFLFFRINKPKTSYKDKKGKYQGQRGITLGKV